MIIRIDAPWFVAGLVMERDRVVRAAPMLHYMVGWYSDRVTRYCNKRGWKFQFYAELTDAERERVR